MLLQKAQEVNNEHGIRFFGVMPVIFVIGGFLPQYYEIFRKLSAGIKETSDKII